MSFFSTKKQRAKNLVPDSTTQNRNVWFTAIFFGGALLVCGVLALRLSYWKSRGRIVDSGGNPIAGANVYALRIGASKLFALDGAGPRYWVIREEMFVTDADGRYKGRMSESFPSPNAWTIYIACKKGFFRKRIADPESGSVVMRRLDERNDVERNSYADGDWSTAERVVQCAD